MKRVLYAVPAVLLFAVTAISQPPPPGQKLGIAATIQRGQNGSKLNLTQAADKLGEADYGFKPSSMPEVRTFGQLFAHVAQAQFGICSAVKGAPNPMQGKPLEQELKTKAEIVKALNDSFAFCDDAYSSLTDQNSSDMVKMGQGEVAKGGALLQNLAHNNEMYGAAGVYLRAKGIVPPSTERMMQGRGRGRI